MESRWISWRIFRVERAGPTARVPERTSRRARLRRFSCDRRRAFRRYPYRLRRKLSGRPAAARDVWILNAPPASIEIYPTPLAALFVSGYFALQSEGGMRDLDKALTDIKT